MEFIQDFLFAELAEGKPVEVLRVGVFRDRNGREVEIAEEDLETFVANFEAGTAGQEVPLDVNHEKQEAAGWVRRLWREGSKLLAEVDWNELGQRLVGEQIYRYLSATIDLSRKVIKSISLVNFPAVKGLQPVELGEGVYGLQAEPGLIERIVEAVRAVFEKEEAGQAEFVIRKEGSEIVLYSSDSSKVLGRFPFGADEEYATEEEAREAARKREQQIQYFKHTKGGEMEGDWAELQGNIQNIVDAWRRWAGSHTACVRELRGKPGITDPEALCAWLHKQAEGKWPAEGSEYSPSLAELETLAEVMESIIADLESKEDKQMTDEEKAALREELREEILAEMAKEEQTVAELREQIREELEVELTEQFERQQELIKFAEEICSGEAALSSSVDEVVELLKALPEEQLKPAQDLLKAKVVDLGERGSSRDGGGEKLPAEFAQELRKWLAAKQSVAEFFELNAAELGEMEQYNLTEFKEENDG